MTAIGQELRPAVRVLARRIERRQWRRFTARRRHAVKPDGRVRREDDHAITIPCAAATGLGDGQGLRRTARDADLFELAVGEEGDEATVGRPEGIRRPFGLRQRLGGERIELAHPEARLARRVRGDQR